MQLFGCFSDGQGSAAFELLFVSAVQFSLLFRHTGLPGLSGYASPPLVSYGQLVLSDFSVYNVFGMTSEIVTLWQAGSTVILAAQLPIVIFCATRRIRFYVPDLFEK